MKRILFVLILLCFFILTACLQQAQIKTIEPAEAKELLDNKSDSGLFVLNVHTPYQGKLDQTDAIIEDWQNIAQHQNQLPEDKNTPILVYCRSGRMSASAAQQLKDLGYTMIYDLKGGMRDWNKAGLKLIDWKDE